MDSQWIAWVSAREGPRSCARRCTAHSQVRSLLALLVQKVREVLEVVRVVVRPTRRYFLVLSLLALLAQQYKY